MIELYYSLKLRRFANDALLGALELLENNKDQSIAAAIEKAKFRVAKELIRRKVVFW